MPSAPGLVTEILHGDFVVPLGVFMSMPWPFFSSFILEGDKKKNIKIRIRAVLPIKQSVIHHRLLLMVDLLLFLIFAFHLSYFDPISQHLLS